MQLKKILFSVLVAIMMFSLVALVATANNEADGLKLIAEFENSAIQSADNNIVKPGTTFNYILKIENNVSGFSAAQVKVSYDESKLSFVGKKDGDLFNSSDRVVVKNQDGVITFIGMKADDINTLNDGVILTLQFKVDDNFDGDIESLLMKDVKITSGEAMLTVPTTVENVGVIKAHNYGEPVITPADCLEPGKATYTCATCGDKVVSVDPTKPALGHTEPAEWSVKTPATCNNVGLKEKACTVCGEILASEEIEKLTHNWTYSTVTAGTEKADGVIKATCTVSGCSAEVTIPKLSTFEGVWIGGTDSQGLNFVTGADIASVSINGKALSKDNYVISADGSKLLIKADYLNTLEEGEYELTITSAYDHEGNDALGDVTVNIEIQEESSIAVIIIIIVIAVVLVGVVATVVVLKKKELI